MILEDQGKILIRYPIKFQLEIICQTIAQNNLSLLLHKSSPSYFLRMIDELS